MKNKTKQTTVTRRLWEQITASLPSLLVAILLFSIVWITWETYRRDNLGFGDKTYWDWMELLVIPVVLAIGAWWLNKSERESEREIAEKNRREDRAIADDRRNQATLEAYFDRMAESMPLESMILATVARTRTLAVLRSLDGKRKGHVVQFLYESGLIDRVIAVVELHDANLSGAVLRQAVLRGADLREADLRRANLSQANLSRADLGKAILSGADLYGADLSRVNLKDAEVTDEQLAQAKSLKGATMPDGTKHD